jgi:ABC-type transporter Mla subunit MlaD
LCLRGTQPAQAASAAKEIKGLIDNSVQKVDAGSALVNRSGEMLTEIVSSVKRVTDIIAEIAAASQEQSTGIDQVNRAVTQMDQVVQTNAAQTEELSSTANSLATEAQDLQTLVARLKLDSGPAMAGVSRAVTAAPTKALPLRTRAGRTPAPDHWASNAPRQRGRRTDEAVLAAARRPDNGKLQEATHDDLEEV